MKTKKNNIFTSLRGFLMLWGSQSISSLGTAMTEYALVVWSYAETGSASSVTLLTLSTFVPTILFRFLAGAIADRWDKKRIMLLADFVAACGTVLVLVLYMTSALRTGHLYVINVLLSLMNAFQVPASYVATSLLVPKEHYTRTGGLQTASGALISILAPALGSVLLAFGGLTAVLAVDLLTFAVAFVTLIFIPIPKPDLPEEAAKEPFLQNCLSGLKYLKEHAGELGIHSGQIMVGGESAGGGLTAALCMLARDRGEVNIAFQMPLYPMLDDRMITASSQDNDAPVWNTASNEAAWGLYLAGVAKDPIPVYAAPARAEDLRNLPPACTYVGTIEPFHDETVDFVERLREQGVEVTFKEYEGCFHAFDMMGAGTKIGKDARAFLLEQFRRAQNRYFADN